MSTEIIKIGEVGVDTGQLVICDPDYIDTQWKKPDSQPLQDHAHPIFRHPASGTLWQFTFNQKPREGINAFPGSYQEVIPQFGQSPNDLIAAGAFVESDVDPMPHIPKAEFSYRGICKGNNQLFCQLNYDNGVPGVGVAFTTGFGDGGYDVYAEIVDTKEWGRRVRKVWIEFFEEDEAAG